MPNFILSHNNSQVVSTISAFLYFQFRSIFTLISFAFGLLSIFVATFVDSVKLPTPTRFIYFVLGLIMVAHDQQTIRKTPIMFCKKNKFPSQFKRFRPNTLVLVFLLILNYLIFINLCKTHISIIYFLSKNSNY